MITLQWIYALIPIHLSLIILFHDHAVVVVNSWTAVRPPPPPHQSRLRQLRNHHQRRHHPLRPPPPTTRTSSNMIPLSTIQPPPPFLSTPPSNRGRIDPSGRLPPSYTLGIAQEDDLPAVSKLTVETFGADAISLTGEFSPLERALLRPGVMMFDLYTGVVAYAEVLWGLRKRSLTLRRDGAGGGGSGMAGALDGPSLEEAGDGGTATSLVLVLASDEGGGDGGDDAGSDVDILATVELRLQPTDAKIPFSIPSLDRIERRIVSAFGGEEGGGPQNKRPRQPPSLQPYLSNLAVRPNARGKGVGKSLVRCVESIARDSWGYRRIYLHVEPSNDVAYGLYTDALGYRDAGFRWKTLWSGGSEDIAYMVKDL